MLYKLIVRAPKKRRKIEKSAPNSRHRGDGGLEGLGRLGAIAPPSFCGKICIN